MNKLKLISGVLFLFLIFSCGENGDTTKNKNSFSVCSDKCEAKNGSSNITCKLTGAEMRLRRETVLASLKKQILEKKELKNGYAFKFAGSDSVLDELTSFIKTERQCCDFFIFGISVSGDKKEAWLEITGPEGTKEFIGTELNF